MQLNAISILAKFVGNIAMINSFVYSNFNYSLTTLPQISIFKTISNVNLSYMKNIFTPKANAKIRPHDIIVDIIILQLTAIKV